MRQIERKDPQDFSYSNDYTSFTQELINKILNSSQTLDPTSEIQLSRSDCNAVSGADYYIATSGTPNTYIASNSSPFPGAFVSQLISGMRFRVSIDQTNTDASTLQINVDGKTYGAKPIVKAGGDPLGGGELIAGETAEFEYIATSDSFKLVHNGLINYQTDSISGVSFNVTLSSPQAILFDSKDLIEYSQINFDYGSNFDAGNHQFIAPIDGIYQFNMSAATRLVNNQPGPIAATGLESMIHLRRNDVEIHGFDIRFLADKNVEANDFRYVGTCAVNVALQLNKGDTINGTYETISTTTGPLLMYIQDDLPTFFSGYLVQQL